MTKERPGFSRRMSRQEINECPVRHYEGPVNIVRSKADLSAAIEELRKETILGFDTETRPAFTKGRKYPPALVQLGGEHAVYLFQLRILKFPGKLRRILSDPGIIKAGVSLDFDVAQLKKMGDFSPAGFVDLGDAARQSGIKNHGLRGLTAVLLGFRITKKAQTSNWARETLLPSQERYAATDAWVGRKLYLQMVEQGMIVTGSPDRVQVSEPARLRMGRERLL